jgi:hypothetical protein
MVSIAPHCSIFGLTIIFGCYQVLLQICCWLKRNPSLESFSNMCLLFSFAWANCSVMYMVYADTFKTLAGYCNS